MVFVDFFVSCARALRTYSFNKELFIQYYALFHVIVLSEMKTLCQNCFTSTLKSGLF